MSLDATCLDYPVGHYRVASVFRSAIVDVDISALRTQASPPCWPRLFRSVLTVNFFVKRLPQATQGGSERNAGQSDEVYARTLPTLPETEDEWQREVLDEQNPPRNTEVGAKHHPKPERRIVLARCHRNSDLSFLPAFVRSFAI